MLDIPHILSTIPQSQLQVGRPIVTTTGRYYYELLTIYPRYFILYFLVLRLLEGRISTGQELTIFREYHVDVLQSRSKKNKVIHDPLLQRLAAQYVASADSAAPANTTAPMASRTFVPPSSLGTHDNANRIPVPTRPQQVRHNLPTAPKVMQPQAQMWYALPPVHQFGRQPTSHNTALNGRFTMTPKLMPVERTPSLTDASFILTTPPAPIAELCSSTMKISPLDGARVLKGDFEDDCTTFKKEESGSASDLMVVEKDGGQKRKWSWAEERGW